MVGGEGWGCHHNMRNCIEKFSIRKVENHCLKMNCMKMIVVLVEEMKKSLINSRLNTNQLEEINKFLKESQGEREIVEGNE